MSLSPNAKQAFINRSLRILSHSTLITNGADELFLMCLRDLETETERCRTALRPPLTRTFIDNDGFGDDDL